MDEPDWSSLRAEFPLLDRCIYLNACSLGPLPRAGREALARYATDWDREGTPVWYSTWMPLLARLRARLSQLLGAPDDSLALAPSVSVALTTLASCIPRDPAAGRLKVLIGELDFPTLGHQWLSRSDLDVEWVPSADGVGIPPAAFAEHLGTGVALVATTHLYYTTGYLQDVRALAEATHKAGAFLLVDGYQTVGCVPVDVSALDVDFYVGGCLKWLSGGPGTAFAYVRPELIEKLEPRGTGWFSTADPFSFSLQELDWAPDARRFETGTWPVPSHYAALAALDLILDRVGVEAICYRLRHFTGRILERCESAGVRTLTPHEPDRRCGVVTVECDRPEEVERALLADGVVVDSRPGRLRLSPHWCLNEDELERGLDLVLARVRDLRL
ncbi:aminotransferase class V-fold PLP-dependent enzyme [Candidatus Nephthysia bennettiae]|uniref:Aminotransferase class V-fold PLP-dependent enzyme n=1 Tax=Candidatus Nephthysia bennettiae TaxID=3127016 RepID=A0A934K5P9_9BACT|nr:aminotransferase class V-fold PLP-dependent enzyme [Candidatus Dormibacteraeota bacterium]MBJ7612003.1 aminotransferase class V-fold PLP-dependent enzyme [Candidatus Dormibacteraeota bacterium]